MNNKQLVHTQITEVPKRSLSNRGPRKIADLRRYTIGGVILSFLFLLGGKAIADGGVTFQNIADNPASGLTFSKHPSPLFAITQKTRADSLLQPISFFDRVMGLPAMGGYGLTGAAVLDFDQDGDLDIYLANSGGADNSLFSNQLMETGRVHFVDVAVSAGVTATSQDSHGVCYGDIDNDGDPDLVVLGNSGSANLLFENEGNSTFTLVANSGIETDDRTSTSCSLGDVDSDGLLDIVVTNTFDLINHAPLFVVAFGLNQHNQLFRNNGDNTFIDVSAVSGINNTVFPDPLDNGQPTITWATSVVDIDLDGDQDIIFADDQAAYPDTNEPSPFGLPNIDRGLLHVFLNDGSGVFTDQPILNTIFRTGAYMGLDFGDFNCDGNMDFFATNFGDYAITLGDPNPPILGLQASRWFLGQGNGVFTDPGVGNDIVATPFGWGVAVFDYDNDGDQDIHFHGGLDLMAQVSHDNQGAIFQNQNCSASFKADVSAVTTDHSRRSVRALAVGDFDQNGFVDTVVPSEMNVAADVPLEPNIVQFGGPYDPTAKFTRFWQEVQTPAGPLDQWTGAENDLGNLVVELNSGNANRWVSVKLAGSINLTSTGTVNRDGIGAVVHFTPKNGNTVMSPVTGGSSYLSQHSLERIFGMGNANEGTIEVLWPGGVRNRLDGVKKFEAVIFPEIPCSYDDASVSFQEYKSCVKDALTALVAADVLPNNQKGRFLSSAIKAYHEAHQPT